MCIAVLDPSMGTRGRPIKYKTTCSEEGCTRRASHGGELCDACYRKQYYQTAHAEGRYRGDGRKRNRDVAAARQKRLKENPIAFASMTDRYIGAAFCGKVTPRIARYCDVSFPPDLPLLADIEQDPPGSASGPTPWEWADEMRPKLVKKLSWDALGQAMLTEQLSLRWPFTHELYESLSIEPDLFRRIRNLDALRLLENDESVVFATGENGSVPIIPGRYLKLSHDRLSPYGWEGANFKPSEADLESGKLRIDRIRKPPSPGR